MGRFFLAYLNQTGINSSWISFYIPGLCPLASLINNWKKVSCQEVWYLLLQLVESWQVEWYQLLPLVDSLASMLLLATCLASSCQYLPCKQSLFGKQVSSKSTHAWQQLATSTFLFHSYQCLLWNGIEKMLGVDPPRSTEVNYCFWSVGSAELFCSSKYCPWLHIMIGMIPKLEGCSFRVTMWQWRSSFRANNVHPFVQIFRHSVLGHLA
jgi:hypothetical protein